MTTRINLLSGEEWRSEDFRVDNNKHKTRLAQNNKTTQGTKGTRLNKNWSKHSQTIPIWMKIFVVSQVKNWLVIFTNIKAIP